MTHSRWTLLVLVFVELSCTAAFVGCHHATRPQVDVFRSTPDDEISKLIGKRSQIKRKKQQQEEPEVKINEEALQDLDLDSLPQFTTERPVRRAKKPKEEDDDDKDSTKKEEVLPIVDFKADYEDENDFHIPNRIGISTQQWGDASAGFVPKGKLTKRMIKAGKFVPGDCQLAYNKCLEGGILLVDAPVSNVAGNDILGRCVEEGTGDLPDILLTASVTGSAWKQPLGMANQLNDALEQHLGQSSVELFTVPKSLLFPSKLVVKNLGNALTETGLCNNVGIRTTSGATVRKLVRLLDDNDMSLTSNSFDFSLTNSKNEALIDICKSLQVIPVVTDPLDGGLSSGVYTATNPSGGQAGGTAKFTFKELEKLQPLHSVQETLAERVRTRVKRDLGNVQDRFRGKFGPPPKINTEITTTQIALNYVIAKGGVPLVPVNTPRQADEVLGCLGWELTDEEVDMLDSAVALCKL